MDIKPTQAKEQAVAKQPSTVSDYMHLPSTQSKVREMLGSERVAAGFISSVISLANNNKLLKSSNPVTVVSSAMVAATLQLSVVPSIGEAYIVPYKGQAQFQLGYKGLIKLAQRSGQFASIIDEVVYEGQLVKKNKFTGEYIFDEDAKKSDKVIGYMARFDLLNGFSKTMYWTKEEVEAHARKFSQGYRGGNSPWHSDFDAMARKTVLKALFSKYAPLSIQMQQAVKFDQSAPKVTEGNDICDVDAYEAEYIDNEQPKDALREAALNAAKSTMQSAATDADTEDA